VIYNEKEKDNYTRKVNRKRTREISITITIKITRHGNIKKKQI